MASQDSEDQNERRPEGRQLAVFQEGNTAQITGAHDSAGQMLAAHTNNEMEQGLVQNSMEISDGNFKGAFFANKVSYHNHFVVETSDQRPTKKRKLLNDFEDEFLHLGGDILVNFGAPITNHSRVYVGEKRTVASGTERIAVKLMPINTVEDAEQMKSEAQAIRDNPHPNIVRYISADFNTEKFMCMYLAMEMCDQTNLHDRVLEMKKRNRKFSFADCMSIAKQLSSGLKQLHKKDILHRDIKPSNVLFTLDGRKVKLTDFSLVKPVRPGRSVTADSSKRIGTDGWRAPEVYNKNNHSKKSDVFSLGFLLYYVWSNGAQVYGSDPDLVNYNIKTNRNRDLSKLRFANPAEALALLRMTLEFDENQRVTAAGVHSHKLCKNSKVEIENPEGEIDREYDAAVAGEKIVVEGHCIVVFDRATSMMHVFKPSTKTWGHMQALPSEMAGWNMTAVSCGEYIYALLSSRNVFRIKYTDPDALWEMENDMMMDHGRFPHNAVLDGYIYVIGGSQWSSKLAKEGERFDLTERKWSRIPDMKTSRKVHSIVACSGHVYSIGGRDDSHEASTIPSEGAEVRGEKFNPTTKEWTPIAPMNKARHAAYAAASNDKIYILGGWREGNRLAEAECYSTIDDIWVMIRNMNVPRSYLAAVSVQGKIYALMGDSQTPLSIEEYDPNENRWTIVDRMPDQMVCRSCASAAVYLPESGQSSH